MDNEKLKKYFTKKNCLLGFIVMFILLIIVWGIKGTHAFYNNTSVTIPLVNAKVGDFLNRVEGNIDRTSDVNLIYYIESETTAGSYILSRATPNANYTFDSSLSKCNLSTASYSFLEDGTVSLRATMTLPNQVVCRLFYKKKNPTHVTIYILEENTYGTISYNNKRYSLTENIPDSVTHNYTTYICQNNATTITYNADTGLSISAKKPDVCNVYFNKR